MKIGKKEEEPEVEPEENGLPEKEEPPSVDIMAQQLKFVACLKILMEELSTLATGFEVDGKMLKFVLSKVRTRATCQFCYFYIVIIKVGLFKITTIFYTPGGHLRYQLYIWLEREVEALRRLCGYASTNGSTSGGELICADAEPPPLPERPTLHQLLIREKADFEAKVQRAVRRKKWLKGMSESTMCPTLCIFCPDLVSETKSK